MRQNENEKPSGDGTDFIKQQSELDQAKNERAKSDNQDSNVPSAKKQEETVKTDVSHKKTGGGKQISPGT